MNLKNALNTNLYNNTIILMFLIVFFVFNTINLYQLNNMMNHYKNDMHKLDSLSILVKDVEQEHRALREKREQHGKDIWNLYMFKFPYGKFNHDIGTEENPPKK